MSFSTELWELLIRISERTLHVPAPPLQATLLLSQTHMQSHKSHHTSRSSHILSKMGFRAANNTGPMKAQLI